MLSCNTSHEKVLKALPLLLEAFHMGLSRNLLECKEIKNMIINAATQNELAHLVYQVAQSRLNNRAALYTAVGTAINDHELGLLPPVLVSLEATLDDVSMSKTIAWSDEIGLEDEQGVLAIVLIVCEKYDMSSEKLRGHLQASSTHQGFLEYRGPHFWAEKCLIFTTTNQQVSSFQQVQKHEQDQQDYK